MAYFDRFVEISFNIQNKLKTFKTSDGLNLQVDFIVEKSVEGTPPQGEITIAGLTQGDISYISTAFDPASKQIKDCIVSLKVGRGDSGSLLIEGNIISSVPNMETANYSIKLQVMGRALQNLQNNVVSFSKKDASLKEVCENVAKNNALQLDFQLEGDTKIGTYAYSGSPLYQILSTRELVKDAEIFISGDKLKVLDKKRGEVKIIEVSAEEGLIGNPTPTNIGCNLTTYLNPLFEVGGSVKLTSRKFPQLNGNYKINRAKHEGGNRSPNWQTKLELRSI